MIELACCNKRATPARASAGLARRPGRRRRRRRSRGRACPSSPFVAVDHVDGVAHELHQLAESADRAVAESANTGGEAIGGSREHYRGCVGVVDGRLGQLTRCVRRRPRSDSAWTVGSAPHPRSPIVPTLGLCRRRGGMPYSYRAFVRVASAQSACLERPHRVLNSGSPASR
jgi:hypothetical protein